VAQSGGPSPVINNSLRGINRFPALLMTFDLLKDWPEVQKRQAIIPEVPSLRDWIKRETKLGNPVLQAEVEKTNDRDLSQALTWSIAVNEAVADLVHDVPPFPFVEEISWEIFCSEAADKFKNSKYNTTYENRLIMEFEKLLPELPPWKN
jgi:hypothetical protein